MANGEKQYRFKGGDVRTYSQLLESAQAQGLSSVEEYLEKYPGWEEFTPEDESLAPLEEDVIEEEKELTEEEKTRNLETYISNLDQDKEDNLGFYARADALRGYEISPTTGEKIWFDAERGIIENEKERKINANTKRNERINKTVNEYYNQTKKENPDLFYTDGDVSLISENEGEYDAKVLNYDNDEEVTKFSSSLVNKFIENDPFINKKLVPKIIEENEDNLNKLQFEISKKYNLDNIDREDYKDDYDAAIEEYNKKINTLISQDPRLNSHIDAFIDGYRKFSGERAGEGLVGKKMDETFKIPFGGPDTGIPILKGVEAWQRWGEGVSKQFPGLRSNILLKPLAIVDALVFEPMAIYGGMRKIWTRGTQKAFQMSVDNIYQPLYDNHLKNVEREKNGEFNDNTQVKTNKFGHVVPVYEEDGAGGVAWKKGDAKLDREDQKYAGIGYNVPMTWGEAKKQQEERLEKNNKVMLSKFAHILNREIVDGEFDVGSFDKLMAGEDGQISKMIAGQGPEVLQALLSLGLAPMVQQAGAMYVERLKKDILDKPEFANLDLNNSEDLDIFKREVIKLSLSEEGKKMSNRANVLAVPFGIMELVGVIPAFRAIKTFSQAAASTLVRGATVRVAKKWGVASWNALKSGVAESITETGQTAIEDYNRYTNHVWDTDAMRKVGEFADPRQYREAAGTGFIVGAFIPFGFAATSQSITEIRDMGRIISGKLDPNSREAIFNAQLANLDDTFKKGGMKESDYIAKKQIIKDLRETNAKIPKELQGNERLKAIDLYTEKLQLMREIADQDEGFTESQKERIKVINIELGKLGALANVRKITTKSGKALEGLKMGVNYLVGKDAKDTKAKAGKNAIALDASATGYISPDGKTIVIDEQKAAEMNEIFTAQHEVLHAVLFNTLYNYDPKSKETTGKNVVRGLAEAVHNKLNTIKQDVGRNQEGYKDFHERLALYKNDPNAVRAEEVLTLFSDALAYGDIKFKEGAWTKIKDATRRILQDVGFANIKIDKDEDVYKLLKDYNTSIAKGRFTRAQKKAFKEGIPIGPGIKRYTGKENIPQMSKKNKAKINSTYDKDTTNRAWWDKKTQRGEADLALSEIFGDLQTDLSFKANKYAGLPGFSKEDFIQGTITDLIPHVRNFKPEMAADPDSKITLSGWINRFVQNKIDGILGRKEATTEKYTEDITEPIVQNQVEDALVDEINELRGSDGNMTLLDSKILEDIVVKKLERILNRDIILSDNTIYEKVSKNKTLTPHIASIRREAKRFGQSIVKIALGGKENNAFIDNIKKYKKEMLDNFTKGYLARFAPETILKSVGGKWVMKEVNGEIQKVFEPKWVDNTVWGKLKAAQIDTQKSSVTGMTDGKQLMMKKPNIQNVITDEAWVNKFVKRFTNKKGKEDYTIIQNKSESVSEQLAAEIILDIYYRNIVNLDSKTHKSFIKNAEIKKVVLKDNYISEIGRQIDRGNARMNRVLKSRIPVNNDGDLYIKEYNQIAKIIYSDNDTIEDFVVDDEWKGTTPALFKFSPFWIDHIRELEEKGVKGITGGFGKSMKEAGVDANTIQDYKNFTVDKEKLHEDNLVIAESPIGRIIAKMYTKKDGTISDNIQMLWYIGRGLDPAGKKETRESVEARKEVRRKNKEEDYTAEDLKNLVLNKDTNKKELPSPPVDYQKDKFGKDITGTFHGPVQDIKDALLNNEQELPPEVEDALPNMRLWNSKNGPMNTILKDIYSVKGKKAQLAKLEEHYAEINEGNKANTIILKYIIQELDALIKQEKISQNNVLTLFQGQANAIKGLKGLTTWLWVNIDGKQRTTKEELKELYGEHMQPNVSVIGRTAGYITNKEDKDIDTWFLDEKKGLAESTQMGTIKRIAVTELDKSDLGKTPLETFVDRINSLNKKDRGNVHHINGNNFRTQRGLDRVQHTKDVNESKKSRSLGKAKTMDAAADMIRRKDPERKGITIVDFDDTLAISDSKVLYKIPRFLPSGAWNPAVVGWGKIASEGKLTPAEFAEHSAQLEKYGAIFDFSEFEQVKKGRKGPLFNLALKRQAKFGSKDIFILTARPQTSAKAIQQFAKGLGLHIPLKNITGLENGTSKAKADWVTKRVAEGYNDFYFADDSYKNVQAVQKVLDVADVKSDVQQVQAKQSKSLGKRFNQIVEETTGVEAIKTFSDVAAKSRGARIWSIQPFVPSSAEDFAGLLYAFIGKGRKGDEQKAWFKKHLFDPLARGIRDINAAKMAVQNDYKALKKLHPDVHKNLKKDSGYNNINIGNAIRVYLWNKNGIEIPGISKRDLKALIKIVKSDPNIKDFADKLGQLTKLKEGYVLPDKNWVYGSVGLDLIDINQTVRRGDHLKEFNENIAEIFPKENLNKIEAIKGTAFREALEDMIYRIKNGTNRNFGSNRYVNGAMNWINNAIGTIMFFNRRSAVLQTISFANFINWTDNNILKAGIAFGNQPQFWQDFAYIFNSDFLKARRSGLQQDVNWQEIATHVRNSKNKFKDAISWMLQKGFLPTKIMDSFAIAFGGATMYRNRVSSYIKEVNPETNKKYTKEEAEEKAWLDFQEVAENTQQSGRPDLISMEQASPLGRILLAFQNVTMQYTRQAKKGVLDVWNRRRHPGQTQAQSDMTNISKVIYYMGVQNFVFNAMQNALFAVIFEDDEDDETRLNRNHRIVNGMADSILRGMGYKMAIIATIKNMYIEFLEQQEKPSWEKDMAYVVIEGVNVSPPLGNKARKVYNAMQTYKFNQKEIDEMGALDPKNPSFEAKMNLISAAFNAPTDRIYYIAESVGHTMDNELAAWQRLAITMGWRDWQVGADVKEEKKKKKKEINLMDKSLKIGDKKISKLKKYKIK